MDMKDRASQWPLAGRDHDLEAFAAAWSSGRCQGVLISGPAGVGKSRLAEGCLAFAVRDGSKGFRATASASAAAVPLGAIAHLIPDGVDLSDPVKGFAQVATALAGPQRRWRWVLWVDDLHLLDAASAVLLRQLLDARVVKLIATVRSEEPISDPVKALAGGDGIDRIDLARFSREQTDAVLQAALGGPVGHRTLHQLHNASDGNALYLRELVLGALHSGTLASDGEIWELTGNGSIRTPKLTELIGARLAAQGLHTRPVLELLALCEPVSLTDALAVVSLEILADLEETGLVEVVTARRRTTVQLAHPLYGEVLRSTIPYMRRSEVLTQQVARAEGHGARRREDLLHIATWRLAATGSAEPGLLVRAATLARHAYDYQSVVALLEAVPDTHHSTETRLILGEAYSNLQRFGDAETALTLADESAASEPEKIMAVRTRALNLFISGRSEDALRVTEDARLTIKSALGRRIIDVTDGAIRALTGDPRRGVREIQDLTDLQSAEQGPVAADAWTHAIAAKANGLVFLGRIADAVELSQGAYDFHTSNSVRFYHPTTHFVAWTAALCEGARIEEARSMARSAMHQSIQDKAAVPYLWLSFWSARNELVAGHYAEARTLYAEALANSRNQNSILSIRLAASGLAAATAALGHYEAAVSVHDQNKKYPVLGLLAGEERLGEAWILAAQGNISGARQVLTEAARYSRDTGHVSSEALILADIARLGGAREVSQRLAELAEISDGLLTQCRAHFAQALAADDPEQLLLVAQELADLRVDVMAAEAAAAAAAIFRSRGEGRRATAASHKATSITERCKGARTPLLGLAEETAPLTGKEKEVAMLAATGSTSREIAQKLTLSVRTVDNHLHHAYTKLGVSTRQELAAAMNVKYRRSP
ncbi:LuxR C-terminal-related transcriptional regulator [Streptomyces sp. NBC_01077]|uniref:LuxR C-terminal-related transcriptional regulator n=1 Tax=Streptomyces sp. NBC_01077 TaxID=2903746 RepID=UPI0038706415|nr:LuxR C-terminal-related transcriptional regulator [Streptomyces sp. NBC_01077]WSV43682.1 LuxR C-terminal-related transcriptional regulator [Streptomyces sp. NBC_01077]